MRKSHKSHVRTFAIPMRTPPILKPPPPPPRHNDMNWRKCIVCDRPVARSGIKRTESDGTVVVLCKGCVRHGYLFSPDGRLIHKEMRDA